ncbi:MAG TPA: septum formation family protein [Acidimicrobiales bacterium]
MSVRKRPASLIGSAALAGLLAVGLGACSDDEPERDETGQVTEGGDESVFDVEVGDCIDSTTEAGQVDSLPLVPCDEPHDGEIYHTYQVPGDEFPGDFTQVTEEQCGGAFADFVGVPYDQSELVYSTLEPTAGSWEQGDRELVCIIADPAGQTTGSLEGANR